jgi:hypothetical protein
MLSMHVGIAGRCDHIIDHPHSADQLVIWILKHQTT